MNILALDVGTSSVKAAVLDVESCRPKGEIARAGYELDSPSPEAAEIPADRLWQAVAGAARQAVAASGAGSRPGFDVEGIGLSILTPALVLLGKDDKPLMPIWTHLDRRSRPAARQVWAAVGEEFLATTGNRPLPGGVTAVSFRQIVDDNPYVLHRVKRFLHVNGWLALHMTGQTAFDPGNASFTGIFGTLTDQQWSPRWRQFFEVDPAWLPPVVCGSTVIGDVRSEVATELGVPAGIPLRLGTADTSCAMLAADMKEGDLLHVVGTTQVVATITRHPTPSPARLTRFLGVGDDYIQVTHNPVGGVALDWLHDLCFRDVPAEEYYGPMMAAALDRKTRVTLDPPFLGGDRLEIEAHRAAFRNLELTTDRLDLLAALLQAMLQRHREALKALGGPASYRRVILTGGGSQVVRRLVPEYREGKVETLDEGSLRGVARLFRAGPA